MIQVLLNGDLVVRANQKVRVNYAVPQLMLAGVRGIGSKNKLCYERLLIRASSKVAWATTWMRSKRAMELRSST